VPSSENFERGELRFPSLRGISTYVPPCPYPFQKNDALAWLWDLSENKEIIKNRKLRPGPMRRIFSAENGLLRKEGPG
jgi:hypothetical protein